MQRAPVHKKQAVSTFQMIDEEQKDYIFPVNCIYSGTAGWFSIKL